METHPKEWVSIIIKKMSLYTENTNLLKKTLILLHQ